MYTEKTATWRLSLVKASLFKIRRTAHLNEKLSKQRRSFDNICRVVDLDLRRSLDSFDRDVSVLPLLDDCLNDGLVGKAWVLTSAIVIAGIGPLSGDIEAQLCEMGKSL